MKRKRQAGHYPRQDTPLDQLDVKILTRLLIDGRISFREMAHEFHASTSTLSSRVSRLEKAGVIRGYPATINFEAIGYDITAIIEINISKGKMLLMEGEIAKLPGVCAVYDVTGDIDGIIIAKFRNRWELSGFAKSLRSLPFVEGTNTHVALATIREDFRVPL